MPSHISTQPDPHFRPPEGTDGKGQVSWLFWEDMSAYVHYFWDVGYKGPGRMGSSSYYCPPPPASQAHSLHQKRKDAVERSIVPQNSSSPQAHLCLWRRSPVGLEIKPGGLLVAPGSTMAIPVSREGICLWQNIWRVTSSSESCGLPFLCQVPGAPGK